MVTSLFTGWWHDHALDALTEGMLSAMFSVS